MKKTIGLITSLMVCFTSFSQTTQTGINTLLPQQELHIAGAPSITTAIGTTGKNVVTPTIRLEGLNQTNNTTHPASPAISTLPIYATVDGDLVIGTRTKVISQTLPGQDGISSSNLIIINGTADVVTTLKTITFTIDRPSLVYLNAMVCISDVSQVSASTPIVDGRARRMGIQFMFSTAPATSGVPTAVAFAENSNSYTNGTTGANILSGFFYYNLGKVVKLTAGTYTLNVLGIASANGNSFQLSYGTNTNDAVNIVAIAL
jgi:hypothetical protein